MTYFRPTFQCVRLQCLHHFANRLKRIPLDSFQPLSLLIQSLGCADGLDNGSAADPVVAPRTTAAVPPSRAEPPPQYRSAFTGNGTQPGGKSGRRRLPLGVQPHRTFTQQVADRPLRARRASRLRPCLDRLTRRPQARGNRPANGPTGPATRIAPTRPARRSLSPPPSHPQSRPHGGASGGHRPHRPWRPRCWGWGGVQPWGAGMSWTTRSR
jgi:hypothetical protein